MKHRRGATLTGWIIYAPGLGVLFGKLQQGVIENQQIIQVAKLRADTEDLYGTKLGTISAGSERPGGFSRDDGASVRKVSLAAFR